MAELTPARNNVFEEEVRFRAPVSESTFTRFGQAVNFINTRQYDTHSWHLNGPINLFTETLGPDGVFNFIYDAEIVGFNYYIGNTNGAQQSLIVDVHRLTGGDTDAGSIFSTRPEIQTSAASDTYTSYRTIDSTTLALPTGHVLAVLSTTEVNAGDSLRLDLDQKSAMRQFQFGLMYRPR